VFQEKGEQDNVYREPNVHTAELFIESVTPWYSSIQVAEAHILSFSISNKIS